jgi:hypothetical protein
MRDLVFGWLIAGSVRTASCQLFCPRHMGERRRPSGRFREIFTTNRHLRERNSGGGGDCVGCLGAVRLVRSTDPLNEHPSGRQRNWRKSPGESTRSMCGVPRSALNEDLVCSPRSIWIDARLSVCTNMGQRLAICPQLALDFRRQARSNSNFGGNEIILRPLTLTNLDQVSARLPCDGFAIERNNEWPSTHDLAPPRAWRPWHL